MKTVRGRAGGKVILFGEHAVVYGVPAVAVGIERGAEARATPSEGPSRLRVRGWDMEARADDPVTDLARAFAAVVEASGVAGGLDVAASADLPPGAGLGCSAALGVAIARALAPRIDAALAAERAMVWERVFHGNPSGIDAAVAARGGCVLFEKGKPIEPLHARGTLHLCVGHSGTASSTKSMVASVARTRARQPALVEQTFEAIRAIVRSGRHALEAGDLRTVGQLMDRNQTLLDRLLLSTGRIDRLCRLARDAGAHGAKLTGAGGGGCVVALVPGVAVADSVMAAWSAAGFEGFSTRVAGEAAALTAMEASA